MLLMTPECVNEKRTFVYQSLQRSSFIELRSGFNYFKVRLKKLAIDFLFLELSMLDFVILLEVRTIVNIVTEINVISYKLKFIKLVC